MFGHAIRVAIQQRPRLASDAESCPCWDHRWPHSEGGRNTLCSWMRRFIYVGSIDCQGFVFFQILAHCCTALEKPAYSCDLNYMIEICGNGVV